MNIKISEGEIAFKIKESELSLLLEGNIIRSEVFVGKGALLIEIDPNHEGQLLCPEIVSSKNGFCFLLRTSPLSIRDLAALGRSRDGVVSEWNNLKVSLCVDIRKT
jgi:hypothetical protein